MLSLFRSRPPVDAQEKAWLETRLEQLAEEFGSSRLLRAEVLVPEPLSVDSDGLTKSDIDHWVSRLSQPLDLDASTIGVQMPSSDEPSDGDSARHEVAFSVAVDPTLSHESGRLLTSIAVQLATRRLLATQLSDPSQADFPSLVELYMVYSGLGLMIPSALYSATSCHGCNCSTGQGTYTHDPALAMSARMLGYALALHTWLRQERSPQWTQNLCVDTRSGYLRSLKFLRRTGDSVCTRESLMGDRPKLNCDTLREQLAGKRLSARVAAFWSLKDFDEAEKLSDLVLAGLYDRRPAIRAESAMALTQFPQVAESAVDVLFDLFTEETDSQVRGAAASALSVCSGQRGRVIDLLGSALRDEDRYVLTVASRLLQQFGSEAEPVLNSVLFAMRSALVRCDHRLIDLLTETLFAIQPDPTESVMAYFDDDPELRQQAVHMIALAEEDSFERPDELA